ncbi:hypothetical protein [Lentzea sp. NBRC 102530]|uniref:hypothetical protein n=1 Tax=Lentzea sp. NBRC 102530 TaxID=3032201 RepID=UPI0025545516|nr:hypothetical protein [Lentzea sp. NBRC 102530]
MIDILNTVVAALAAGAAVGFSDTASTAVKDSYGVVKNSVSGLLRRRGAANDAEVEELLADPENNREALAAALADADDTERDQLKVAAERVTGSVRVEQGNVLVYKSPGSAVGPSANITNINFTPR